MKKGFALLEIMLALAVSSLLAGVLFQVLYQLSFSVSQVTYVSNQFLQNKVIYNVLDTQISGVFLPELIKIHSEKKEKEKKSEKDSNSLLKKAFYSKNEDQNLSLLTFITTNPLAKYNSAQPRMVRVLYQIIKNSKDEQLSLYQKEISDITDPDFIEKSKSAKGYLITNSLVSCTVKFFAQTKKIKKENSQKPKKNIEKEQEEKSELIEQVEWNTDQIQENQKDKEYGSPLLPSLIEVTITFGKAFKYHKQVYYFSPCYGIQPMSIKNRKPLEVQGATKAEESNKKIEKIIDGNPLTMGLQSKFDKHFSSGNSKKTTQGPVTQGMQ